MHSRSTPVVAVGFVPKRQVMSELIPMSAGHLHNGPTLAEIEQRLRADGRSQEQIDMSLALILLVREELARRGKWPPPKRQFVS